MSQLAIVATAVIVPIAVIETLQVSDINNSIVRAREERVGVSCLDREFRLLRRTIDSADRSPAPQASSHRTPGDAIADGRCFHLKPASSSQQTTSVDASSSMTVGVIGQAMKDVADSTGLTFDADIVITDAADGTAYVLPDALASLARAFGSHDRIRAAKNEAIAASRLALLDTTILEDVKRAAPWSAKRLAPRQSRLNAAVALSFARLDLWESRPTAARTVDRSDLPRTIAATDELFRAMVAVLNERLSDNMRDLQHKRMAVVGTAVIVLSFALSIVVFVGRNIMIGHRNELLQLEELSLKEARFKAIFVGSPQPIAIIDCDGNVIERNEAYRMLVGAPQQKNDALPLFAPLRSDEPTAVADFFERVFRRRSTSSNGEFTFIRDDDTELRCVATATTIESAHNTVAFYAVILSDVTEHAIEEHRLRRQATHDKLTEVGNRELLLGRLEAALTCTQGKLRFALLFIDVDDFKTINDTLGHLAGDACLQAFARRLSTHVRAGDVVTRYGGDEFAVLLCDSSSVLAAQEISQRLRQELRAPIAYDDKVVVVSSSIGLAIDDGAAATPEQIIERADRAMYLDKSGKSDRSVSIRERTHAFVGR